MREDTIIDPNDDAAAPRREDDEKLRADLVKAVRSVCPYWMEADRDDLVQVAMMAVLRQRQGDETGRSFPASYLRKVAYTVLVDEIRRRQRRKDDVPIDNPDSGLKAMSEHPGPERGYRSREISKAIRLCLATLVDDRKLAVTLYLLGNSVPEVARRLGWDRKRSSNLVYRGLDNLRQCLEAQGITP